MQRFFLTLVCGFLTGAGGGFLPAAEPELRPTLREFTGLCGHTVQFRPVLYRPVCGWVRDYHPVEWDLGKDPAVLPPWPQAKNGVDWQQVYGSWQAEKLTVSVSLMFESLRREVWTDIPAQAEAYGRSFAREFGPSGSRRLVGAVEVGNEPGKWSDADYRTMLQSMSRGLRAGDPKLKIATCNLALGESGDYAKSVRCLEGLEDCYDILNLHVYAQLTGWPTWKRSWPEDPALPDYLNTVKALCAWRDAHAAGKPLWITEFGWDAATGTPDPKTEFRQWQGNTEAEQAHWLVRSVLCFAALPVERAAVYFFNDSDQAQIHGASGLTRNFQPKPAWYAMAHLLATLGDCRFVRVVKDEPGTCIVQEYGSASDPALHWLVAWSPTGHGRKAEMTLPVAGELVRATRTPLGAEAEEVTLRVSGDGWVLPLTEAPLFVLYRK